MIEINEELKKLIEENVLAFATVDENGNPHCIAVAFAKVVSKNQILVTDNYMVETVKTFSEILTSLLLFGIKNGKRSVLDMN